MLDYTVVATCGADGVICILHIDSAGTLSFIKKFLHVGDGELNSCCLINGHVVTGGDDGKLWAVNTWLLYVYIPAYMNIGNDD